MTISEEKDRKGRLLSLLIERQAQGQTVKAAAAEMGMSYRTAIRWLTDEGIHAPIPGRQKGVAPKRQMKFDRVLQMHYEGRNIQEIAQDVQDVTSATVALWLKDEGLIPLYAASVQQMQIKDVRAEQQKRFVEIYTSGVAPEQAAKTIGINITTAHR